MVSLTLCIPAGRQVFISSGHELHLTAPSAACLIREGFVPMTSQTRAVPVHEPANRKETIPLGHDFDLRVKIKTHFKQQRALDLSMKLNE